MSPLPETAWPLRADVPIALLPVRLETRFAWNPTTSAPRAAGDPRSLYTDFDCPTRRVVYRSGDGHIHELRFPAGEAWSDSDLTALAGAPPAAGDPMGYYTDFDGPAVRVVYRGTDSHIHELWYRPGTPWSRGDLTALAAAPPAAGDPMGYYTEFDGPAPRVVYRGTDSHIHELWYRPGTPWSRGDLTALAAAPPAAGDPMGYYTDFDGPAPRVVYRGTDSHIHELWYRPGTPWSRGDLTALAAAPPAAGDPMGYYTDFDGPAPRVVYRGTDSHIHELWYRPGTPWSRGDLTALAAAPPAAGDPMGYYTEFDGPAPRVVYRGTDSHIHELWYRPGTPWSRGDLTALAAAPPAAGDPMGYYTDFDGPAPRVVYRGTDSHIHEVSYGSGRPWTRQPLGLATPRLRARVYPDQVHIDAHDASLSKVERQWGAAYWNALAAPDADEDARRAAWDQLAQRLGARRAGWVARVMRPPTQAPPDGESELRTDRAWQQTAVARGLPRQWYVTGSVSGRRSDGEVTEAFALSLPPVPTARRPLPIGIDPGSDTTETTGLPQSLLWLTDYDVARQQGMAFDIPLPEIARELDDLRVDRLLVFGVDVGSDADAGAGALRDLLEAHHHTDGLAFVAPGTPTNNTETAASGSDSRSIPTSTEMTAPDDFPVEEDTTRAGLLLGALGLGRAASDALVRERAGDATGTRSVVLGARGGAADDETAARAMNTALWPLTWGYFAWHFLTPTLNDEDVAWARQHFIDHVRAGGPLPALRIGSQPYGVLPVTPLRSAVDDDLRESKLVQLLQRALQQVWRPAVARVPTVRTLAGTTPELLLRILSQSAYSVEWAGRPMLGREQLEYVWRLTEDRVHLAEASADVLLTALGALGIPSDVRIARVAFLPEAFDIDGSLDAAPEDLDACLNWLRRHLPGSAWIDPSPWEALRDEVGLRALLGHRPPLLHRLLRHAALVELAMAAFARPEAAELVPTDPDQPAGLEREPELVNVRPGATMTIWRLLAQSAPGGGTIGRALHDSPPASLRDFSASTAQIAELPAATTARLAAQTLDLASHRLDAWVTSVAWRRLLRRRAAAAPAGTHLGAYAWVEHLRPASGPGHHGYLHAPSQSQAATAAVLQAAHLAALERHDGTGSLDIDLSSGRVRRALWLLDGLRRGLPFGALLGHRFERRLQDAGLGWLIDQFRVRASLEGTVLTPDGPGGKAPISERVTDGLALHTSWCTDCGQRTLNLATLDIPPQERATVEPILEAALDMLHDLIDAVGDALMAETVHHVVSGTPLRAGAAADVLSGDASPPDGLDFLRTPRSGTAIVHRLAFATSTPWPVVRGPWPAGWPESTPEQPPAAAESWPALDRFEARAFAEPTLNALAADLLPAPSQVRCGLVWGDGAPADAPPTLPLSVLPLSPLDYVDLAQRDAALPPESSELGQRLLAQVSDPADALAGLDFSRRATWAADVLSVNEFLEAARTVAALLLRSRALEPADLQRPGEPPNAAVDVDELHGRATAAVARLDETIDALTQAPASRTALALAAGLAVPDSYPSAGLDAAAVAERGARTLAELRRRRQHVLATVTDGSHDAIAAVSAIQAVFGADADTGRHFPVLPRFACADADALAELARASKALQGGDDLVAARWLHQVARVQDGVRQLVDANVARQALLPERVPPLAVLQLSGPSDRWIGLPQPAPLPAGGVSVVLQTPIGTLAQDLFQTPLGGARPPALSGVLIADWVEVIPSASQTTGIAVRADTPNACAPQAILLAVGSGGPWSPRALQELLEDTIDLVHIRAADPEQLRDVGQLLPAILCAFNAQGHTVSTDFLGDD